MQVAEHDAVFTSAEEQEKWLADAMALVQHHAFYMHRALVSIFFLYLLIFYPPPPLSLCYASFELAIDFGTPSPPEVKKIGM
jgi:hypothetical protein